MTRSQRQRGAECKQNAGTVDFDAEGIGRSFVSESQTESTLIGRIERALLLLAFLIELDGDVHVPMYEKFEAELAELKAVADVKARAGQRLMAYRESGARKAICDRNLSFSSSEGPLPYLGL